MAVRILEGEATEGGVDATGLRLEGLQPSGVLEHYAGVGGRYPEEVDELA